MFNLDPMTLLTHLIVLVVALPFHEFAHAWTAYRFGDDTAKAQGRLTLNPLAHLDLIGSMLILTSGFGWAKPVPVNPYTLRRRSPSALMWVSLAGPMSNFLLAVLAAIPLRILYATGSLSIANSDKIFTFLSTFIIINLGLMLFNLIPIAPLDGEKIAEYFLPQRAADFMARMVPYGPILLMALLFLLPMLGLDVISTVIGPTLSNLYYLLIGGFGI